MMHNCSCLSELTIQGDIYIDCLLTQILRIDEEEFYLQNLSSDKPLPRLLIFQCLPSGSTNVMTTLIYGIARSCKN